MPTSPANSSPGSDLMADFYVEADDHLAEIRRGILKLEEQLGQAALDRESLDKLFRSFHSLKGICGMAGLHQAEQLSHRAEDFLRALSRHETVCTEDGFSALILVAQKLEELVAGHRQGQSPSDITALLDRVSSLATDRLPATPASKSRHQGSAGYPAEVLARVQAARQHGRKILRGVFRPSPELDHRGVNVNSAHGQLQTVGEILYSGPKVEAGGELRFEFLVACASEPSISVGSKFDGVELVELDDAPTAQPSAGVKSPGIDTTVPSTSFAASSHFVRVDLNRLDELMRIMGDLVVHRARLEEALGRAAPQLNPADNRVLSEITHGFSRELRHLRDGLMRVRMVPISELFERLPFIIRDLSRESGKKIRLHLQGQQTELDKYLVERLKDPLLHLVRNAVSHGIETLSERASAGKSPEGNITLRASTSGETVLIEVTDDGSGIEPSRIADRARASGLQVSVAPDSAEVLELLCTPGFSTRDLADLGAGRGIGMAAVKSNLSELGGEIEMDSQPGCGATFRLRLPLTLAIADALIISSGGQRFAMPQAAVQEITTTEEASINRLERNEIVKYRKGILPLIRLADLFGLQAEPRRQFPILIVGSGLNAVGIVADQILGHREIVIRPVNDPLLRVPGISGATELGDGRAILILDSASLTQSAKARRASNSRSTIT